MPHCRKHPPDPPGQNDGFEPVPQDNDNQENAGYGRAVAHSLSLGNWGLQARGSIECYLASRLNGDKIFGSGSVSGKGLIRPSGAPRLREWQDFFRVRRRSPRTSDYPCGFADKH